MLSNIYIKNFAIIDEIEIDFHENMSVLTGETGAGKSILIDSSKQLVTSEILKEVGAFFTKTNSNLSLFAVSPESSISKLTKLSSSMN